MAEKSQSTVKAAAKSAAKKVAAKRTVKSTAKSTTAKAKAKDIAEYNRKRKFEATPEPSGKVGPKHKEPIFVIQKHDASRLHYDFRLEVDGVLASWAVPMGPSQRTGVRRLAA